CYSALCIANLAQLSKPLLLGRLSEAEMYCRRSRRLASRLRRSIFTAKIGLIAGLGIVLLTALGHGAEGNFRFVKKFQIPGSSEVVLVSEGDFEPRSIGSYSLRVYGGSSKKFPTDDFVVGLIRPRNGTVETVRFDDIDGDQRPDIVVIIRSAGS